MRSLSIPALLALAAASSAQTLVLSPVAISGYRYNGGLASATITLTNELATYGYSSQQIVGLKGWRAEFDLSVVPIGNRIVSATLATTVTRVDVASPYVPVVRLGAYGGNGTIPAAFPTLTPLTSFGAVTGDVKRLDVAAALRAATSRYAGFQFDTPAPPYTGGTSTAYWSEPTLTLTYGPPVKIPIVLGDFRGNVRRVPVTVEFRRPGTLEVVSSDVVYPDATGVVEVGAAPGTYDVSIRADNCKWLRRTLPSVEAYGPLTLPAVSLVNGDVNGDNVVSAIDRARVTAALGTSQGQSGYNRFCDLDTNGVVNAVDRAIVTARLGSVGDN